MRWPDLAERKRLLVAHPLAMGFVWGAGTVLLVALAEIVLFDRSIDRPWLLSHLLAFAVASPAWGYVTRWFIMRSQCDVG